MNLSTLATQNSQISPQAAAQELLSRRQARTNLLGFTSYTTLGWSAGKIHRDICAQLDRVVRGEIDRLMLLCPPQHGKSSVASKRYPAYVLGLNPREDIISASATETLASGFGRDVRNCIAAKEYRNVFPETVLAEDSQAKGMWNTKQGGSYYAVGVGGQLFGRGGMAIIDDPFGSWADAQSETQREKVWDWFTGTLYNRVRPGKPIILIQHRMHEDDLAGRLIERQKSGGDTWEIVNLPATIDDPPWAERYDADALRRIRANMDPRQWSALFLQNPTPEDGTFFQRPWFKRHNKRPDGINVYITSDYAVTEGDGDFTEHGVWGLDQEDRLSLLGGWYGQSSSDVWIERLLDLIVQYKPLCVFGEAGVIEKAIRPQLERRMRERKVFCRLEWLPSIHDKPTRARGFQSRAAMGLVSLPEDEYGERVLSQLLSFPAGKFDDAVDMCSLMGRAIDQAHSGIVSAAPEEDDNDSGYGSRREDPDSWRL
jgi:predicted phage terminase large subunit-like protein